MKSYFVTGTDTGVGKTYVASTLARRCRELRPTGRVFAYKPIETGSTSDLGEDQRELVNAAGGWQEGTLRGLVALRMPAAPHVAAVAEGRAIDVEDVVRTFREGSRTAELSLLEGAGGWRVPITETVDMAELAKRIEAPLIVVGRAGLGTINHCLLTIEAIERDGCAIAALVLSHRADDDAAFTRSNADEIARRWPGRVLILGREVSALDPLL